ncbi:MAG: 3-keto-5-aminohexanoate cleavage protein [Halobacteriaceae archaeon]
MTYTSYLAQKPLIITAALTGGVHGKEANPHIPETPSEIATAAAEVEAAGAAIVHLHARKDTGERAFSVERFQELTQAVREATDDIIIQHSTGGTAAPLEYRRQPLQTDPPPDMASLDMGPLNRYTHLTSENTRGMIDTLFEDMQARNIKPELEVFNDGHLNEVHALCDRKDLADPIYTTLIFGSGTTSRARPRNYLNAIDNLPESAEFNTLGFGQHQLPFAALGIIMGGHIRVGLEDNIYFREGELATSNAQLVKRVRNLAELLERPVATPKEAREILGI